jgi:hydrogenase maturation protease HycI
LLTDSLKMALLPYSDGVSLYITVGNSLRCDDGAGPYIASQITDPGDNIYILDVADRPENGLFEAEKVRPSKTVVIDAADFGGGPGEAKVIPLEFIPATTLSTHTFPLPVITKMLQEETATEVFFIGIQSVSVELGEGLSKEVKKTSDEIIAFINGGYKDA